MAASPLKERQTAENMQSKVANTLSSFDIPEDKIHVFARDSASSMIRITSLLNVRSWDCFAHKLQLAVKDGLRLMSGIDDGADSLLGRVFKIFRKMKKSEVDNKQFSECQKLFSLPERILIEGIKVRWNSIYDVLTHVIVVCRALELFLLDHTNYPQLDATDWELIKKIVEVLKLLWIATNAVRSRFHSPISVVIALYKVILRKLEQEEQNRTMPRICTAVHEELIAKMCGWENEELVLASMLEPRFKDAFFPS